jgi:hypothetical protein
VAGKRGNVQDITGLVVTRGFIEVTGPHCTNENDGLNLLSTALHDVTQISPFRLILNDNTDIQFWK